MEIEDIMIWRFVTNDIVYKDGFHEFFDKKVCDFNTPERQYLMNVIFNFVNWEVVARIGSQAREQFYKNE